MFASLVTAVIGWGVPAKMAKPFIFVLGISLAVALFFGAKALYDHGIIAKHDLKVEAQQAKDDKKADNGAAVQRRTDDTRSAQEQQELSNVLATSGPSADDRRRNFYRCLRLQQDARAHGLQSPTCG